MAYKRRPGESAQDARNRWARAKGYKSYYTYRHASAQRRAQATARLAKANTPTGAAYRRAGGHQARAVIETRRRYDVRTARGRVLTFPNFQSRAQQRRLRAALRSVPPDTLVSYRACVEGGRGFRTITGELRADDLLGRLRYEADPLLEGGLSRETRRALEEGELDDLDDTLRQSIARGYHKSPPKPGEPATASTTLPDELLIESLSVTIPEPGTRRSRKRRRRTREELLATAKRLGIRGRHRLKRGPLEAAIRRARRLEAEPF